ncbi:MAG: RecX family transcriptional regulator [Bacteroidales bacterium]|nr:RecX family transcriptional regulator [Bacteroidales bacterium]
MDSGNILSRAQRLCSKKEKCEFDLRKKLHQWGVTEREMEKVIKSLKAYDFINHRRYATSFANDKLQFNHWGKKKIEYALRSKNIEAEYIQEAINGIPEEEYDRILYKEIEKKNNSLRTNVKSERKKKICNYLLQKGFESGKVFEFVENTIKKDNNR